MRAITVNKAYARRVLNVIFHPDTVIDGRWYLLHGHRYRYPVGFITSLICGDGKGLCQHQHVGKDHHA